MANTVRFNYLTNNLLLKVESCSDDRDGIVFKIASILAKGRMHCDQLLQLCTTIDDSVVRSQDPFEQFSYGPGDKSLYKLANAIRQYKL